MDQALDWSGDIQIGQKKVQLCLSGGNLGGN